MKLSAVRWRGMKVKDFGGGMEMSEIKYLAVV